MTVMVVTVMVGVVSAVIVPLGVELSSQPWWYRRPDWPMALHLRGAVQCGIRRKYDGRAPNVSE